MKRFLLFLFASCTFVLMSVIACNITLYVSTKSYIYNDLEKSPVTQTALVPGAAIYPDGTLSSVFVDRVDMAIKLYQAGKVSKILVSGDNSTVIYNEVNPARLYLISEGIPDEDIFLDHAGFDTYSSMYRARDIFGVTSVLITTQSFHLPRSVFIARTLGLEAYGVRADVRKVLFRNYIREALAVPKAVLDLLFTRSPKFLGEPIPITGDGRNYP